MRPRFDPNRAETWNEGERAVYETGYREGESNNVADWIFALDAFCSLPDNVDDESPQSVARYIGQLQTLLRAYQARGVTS